MKLDAVVDRANPHGENVAAQNNGYSIDTEFSENLQEYRMQLMVNHFKIVA